MQFSMGKAKTAAVITIALLMASVTLLAMPVQPVEAQLSAVQPYIGAPKAGDTADVTTVTVPSLSFRPNPIGVGQSLLVNMWINPSGPSNNVIVPLGGFVITITKPDGTKDVYSIASEPATFANWFEYTPNQVGQWKIKFEFLGAYFPAGRYFDGKMVTNSSGEVFRKSTYYKPSSTEEQNLTVQQDMVLSWPLTQPTDYWTRPASLNNRGYWPILGAYPPTGYVGYDYANWDTLYPNTNPQYMALHDFTPWVQAPNSAHIVWKQKGAVAGLIGGPATQYGTTSSPSSPDLIYAGRCYDTATIQDYAGNMTSCAVCYDLRTGERYYAIPTSQGGITPNLIAYVKPQATPGTIAGEEIASDTWSVELLSISGSYLRKINPYTGALTGNYSIAPLSGGTFHNQINGYVLNIQDLGSAAGDQRYRLINWTTRGNLANLTTSTGTRIISNTTYQRSSLPSMMDFNADLGAVSIDTYSAANLTGQPFGARRWWIIVEIYKLSTGALLYNISTNEYPDILYHNGPTIMDHGRVACWTGGGYWVIVDGSTGKWFRSEKTDYPWSSTGFGAYAASSGYGLLIRYAYNHVYAFNWTDGKIVWKYTAPAGAPFETPYTDENGTTVYSFNGDGDIADGKLYVANSEHTTTWPITRGWGLHCINITTGELIWKINNPMSYGAVADGYLAASNSWDGYMYVFGKGKSATTVTAPDVAVPLGTGVMIKGTVLDMSPAQSGTPCVSKESMSQQMEYVHLQMPIGGLWNNETITGVPVILTAIGSDGTVIDIGTTTTDGYYGAFTYAWDPPNEGIYKIIATFAGDDSYGSSSAATGLVVSPAPASPTPTPTPPEAAPDNTPLYILGATIAIIAAVAIATILILRKRP